MWFAKLKKGKLQYVLLGIISMIAVAMICVGTVVTIASSDFAGRYYEGDSTPDVLCITVSDSVVSKINKFYKSKGDKVRNYKDVEMYSVSTNLLLNNETNTSLMSYVIPIEDKNDLSNKIEIRDKNKEENAPNEGEMWISSTIANLRNINVGDTAEIIDANGESFQYKISAIVNDSNQSSTAIGVLMVYVNEADIEKLKNLPTANLITMNCDGDTSEVSNELIEYINEPLGGAVIDKSLFVLSATMNATLIGGISLMAAVLLVIILILIVRSNIKSYILREYKSIGTYKAIGYTTKKIRKIYSYGYGIISLIASLVGVLIAIPMIDYICNIAFKNLGKYSLDGLSIGILIIAFLIFNLIVYLNVYGVLKCIKKVNPIEAINIGVTSSKEKLKKSLIKNNSSSFCMAINDIFKYKKSSIITTLVFILVFFISSFFLNVAYSMKNLDDNLYKIFGTGNGDLAITAPSDIENSIDQVKDFIDNDSRIKEYYLWDVTNQWKIGIDNSKYKLDGGMLLASIYNKYNEEDFTITNGMNPRNKNEVSVSELIMANNNLSIGDYIDINVDGNKKEFLIVGKFQSMMSGGQSIRLTYDSVENEMKGNVAFVNLENIEDYKELKKDIESKYKGIKVEKVYSPLKEAATQVIETSVPISIVLLIGVLIFGIFNIVNVLVINNIDNRKKYGIMKSLGFTSKYIRRRNNFRILSLAVIGAIVGTGLSLLYLNKIMVVATGFDVAKISLSMTGGLVGITFILIMLTLHICNKSIKKISTVELIKE